MLVVNLLYVLLLAFFQSSILIFDGLLSFSLFFNSTILIKCVELGSSLFLLIKFLLGNYLFIYFIFLININGPNQMNKKQTSILFREGKILILKKFYINKNFDFFFLASQSVSKH